MVYNVLERAVLKMKFKIAMIIFLLSIGILASLLIPRLVTGDNVSKIESLHAEIDRHIDGPYNCLETACRELLQLQPYNCQAWAQLGKSLHLQGKDREAIEAIEKAILLDKTGKDQVVQEARIQQAMAYIRIGDKDKGKKIIQDLKNRMEVFDKHNTPIVFGMLAWVEEKMLK